MHARQKIQMILNREPKLTYFGIGLHQSSTIGLTEREYKAMFMRERQKLLEYPEEFVIACKWWALKTPTKTIIRSRSSYSLKHDLERYFGTYVSNGSLIVAGLYMGFKCRPTHLGSPNVFFNLSKKQQRKTQ